MNHFQRHQIVAGIVGLTLLAMTIDPASAGVTWFVSNTVGSDGYDGRSTSATGDLGGPFRSIRRAFATAGPADVVVIANTGRPYFECLELRGDRHTGFESAPFTVEGNGAVVSGARPVPVWTWQKVESGLWKFRPRRKGHFQLILNSHPVPESIAQSGVMDLADLPAGHWRAHHGEIHYRAQKSQDPRELPFWFAVDSTGLTIYGAHHAWIRNLKFVHFRIDGVNAHDRCHDVVLDGIVCAENGRSGVTVAGTSQIELRRSTIIDNRLHSVFISEHGGLNIIDSTIDEEPSLDNSIAFPVAPAEPDVPEPGPSTESDRPATEPDAGVSDATAPDDSAQRPNEL